MPINSNLFVEIQQFLHSKEYAGKASIEYPVHNMNNHQ